MFETGKDTSGEKVNSNNDDDLKDKLNKTFEKLNSDPEKPKEKKQISLTGALLQTLGFK